MKKRKYTKEQYSHLDRIIGEAKAVVKQFNKDNPRQKVILLPKETYFNNTYQHVTLRFNATVYMDLYENEWAYSSYDIPIHLNAEATTERITKAVRRAYYKFIDERMYDAHMNQERRLVIRELKDLKELEAGMWLLTTRRQVYSVVSVSASGGKIMVQRWQPDLVTAVEPPFRMTKEQWGYETWRLSSFALMNSYLGYVRKYKDFTENIHELAH